MDANLLIDELQRMTEESTDAVRKFKELDSRQLNFQRDESSWSVLQCIEHLNLYGDYYLPEIERKMIAYKHVPHSPVFNSGIIGNYFANLMLVKDGKMKKMKSPKDKIPNRSALSITTLDRFLKQQELLKSLLQQARTVNLTRTKTEISLTNLIKLRLGDTYRFYVYHIERHVLQAKRVVASFETSMDTSHTSA